MTDKTVRSAPTVGEGKGGVVYLFNNRAINGQIDNVPDEVPKTVGSKQCTFDNNRPRLYFHEWEEQKKGTGYFSAPTLKSGLSPPDSAHTDLPLRWELGGANLQISNLHSVSSTLSAAWLLSRQS